MSTLQVRSLWLWEHPGREETKHPSRRTCAAVGEESRDSAPRKLPRLSRNPRCTPVMCRC